MVQRCVHKGCQKEYTDDSEPCNYHPGPPVFHEGQKGWKCCKPRVLSFDEFLSIPPCTTGLHSTIDDTPAPEAKKPLPPEFESLSAAAPPDTAFAGTTSTVPRIPIAAATATPAPAPPQPETSEDEPDVEIADGVECRRKGCNKTYKTSKNGREGEQCVFHPGAPLFHEGSKGYTCCKRRVLEFDQFMKLEGCARKPRHMFVGSGKKRKAEEAVASLDAVRSDFYQTPTTVCASLYLKAIIPERSKVVFQDAKTIALDLVVKDEKRYQSDLKLWGSIDVEKSKYAIRGTKLEFDLIKADVGIGWPVLKEGDRLTGEIIQSGRAGRV